MSRKFQVGDRVRYVGYKGKPPRDTDPVKLPTGAHGVVQAWPSLSAGEVAVLFDDVRSSHSSGMYSCLPEWLRHVYDGHEPVSWSECVWQPKHIEARS